MQGLMMVDMGAAIILLAKKWTDAHSLTMKEKVPEYISGTTGTMVSIVGTTSMALLLVPTLELDMDNIAICLGDFYQGLLRCDLLCRHNEAFGVVTITLPWLDLYVFVCWPQKKVGCIVVA